MTSWLFTSLTNLHADAARTYKLPPAAVSAVAWTPLAIVAVQLLALGHPRGRQATLWLLQENHPVEILTFASLLAGGFVGLWLAWKAKHAHESLLVSGFFFLFGGLLVLTALEEIAWGQWFFHFETPAAIAAINRQGETTLHNLGALQGHSELMRLTFGLGGIIGMVLARRPIFRRIGTPPVLLPWFLLISAHAGVDVFNDFVPIQSQFDYWMQRTSELVELLVGISALLFLYLHVRVIVGNELPTRR